MCIIAIKNKDSKLFKEEELKNMFQNNPDGAGFMYVDNEEVIIDKGYMTFESFKKHYNKLCNRFNNFKNKSLILHFRIGTSGTNSQQNCHPYPITSNIKDLHKTFIKSEVGIAHNGIISDYAPILKNNYYDTNDTQEFIMHYLSPLKDNWSAFYKNRRQLQALKKITNSKLVFLDKNDNVYTSGDFVEHKGRLFSNTSYENYEIKYNYNYSYPNYKYSDNLDYNEYYIKLNVGDHVQLETGTIIDITQANMYYFNLYNYNLYDKYKRLIYKNVDILDYNYESKYF